MSIVRIPPQSSAQAALRSYQVTKGTVDLTSETEKQNKIEGIELEAIGALRTSVSNGSAALAKALSNQITELSTSGLVSVRSQAQELLQNLQSAH